MIEIVLVTIQAHPRTRNTENSAPWKYHGAFKKQFVSELASGREYCRYSTIFTSPFCCPPVAHELVNVGETDGHLATLEKRVFRMFFYVSALRSRILTAPPPRFNSLRAHHRKTAPDRCCFFDSHNAHKVYLERFSYDTDSHPPLIA